MKTIDDNELTKLTADDPEKGFRLLMAKYREPIYRHIRRMDLCHEDAEDAVQETFVRVFRSLASFKGECSLRSWIYRIATNEALRLIKRQGDERTASIDATEGMTQIMADAYVDYSDLETVKLQKAISALPEKQQQAFNLRYYDELDYDEIARITGSTAGSAKANYHVAKEKIIKIIGGLVAASIALLIMLNLPSLLHAGDGFEEVEEAFANLDLSDREYLMATYEEDLFINE